MKMDLLVCLLLETIVFSTLAADCQWSLCSDTMTIGQNICNKFRQGSTFSGKQDSTDCPSKTEKVECCQPTECKWSITCYGSNSEGSGICSHEFGSGWTPNGETKHGNCGWRYKRHICCN